MWTSFIDMHSGGGRKTPYEYIYIEAPEYLAVAVFKEKFGKSPYEVTCDCCGQNFSIDEEEVEDLEQATGYERGCHYDIQLQKYIDKPSDRISFYKYMTLEDFKKREDVLIITKDEIL